MPIERFIIRKEPSFRIFPVRIYRMTEFDDSSRDFLHSANGIPAADSEELASHIRVFCSEFPKGKIEVETLSPDCEIRPFETKDCAWLFSKSES